MSGEDLARACAAIIGEARAHVAAGRDPRPAGLEARIRAAGERARAAEGADAAAIARAERSALKQLERVVAVHRSRALVARTPAVPPATSAPNRRALLRTRPTITGTMEVRARREGDAIVLAWDPAPKVASWEVRFSEQTDVRTGYREIATAALPGDATSVELPLGDRALRVHLIGRGRDGRLARRAVISALTRESWSERWQRKASAS
jgi:hypothetical protein